MNPKRFSLKTIFTFDLHAFHNIRELCRNTVKSQQNVHTLIIFQCRKRIYFMREQTIDCTKRIWIIFLDHNIIWLLTVAYCTRNKRLDHLQPPPKKKKLEQNDCQTRTNIPIIYSCSLGCIVRAFRTQWLIVAFPNNDKPRRPPSKWLRRPPRYFYHHHYHLVPLLNTKPRRRYNAIVFRILSDGPSRASTHASFHFSFRTDTA